MTDEGMGPLSAPLLKSRTRNRARVSRPLPFGVAIPRKNPVGRSLRQLVQNPLPGKEGHLCRFVAPEDITGGGPLLSKKAVDQPCRLCGLRVIDRQDMNARFGLKRAEYLFGILLVDAV